MYEINDRCRSKLQIFNYAVYKRKVKLNGTLDICFLLTLRNLKANIDTDDNHTFFAVTDHSQENINEPTNKRDVFICLGYLFFFFLYASTRLNSN